MHPSAVLPILLLPLSPDAVESSHTLSAGFDEARIVDSPVAVAIEYPLAAQFVSAHPQNYVAGGMADPEYVIVHTQEGVYEGTISWFQYSGSDVSTHYVMRSFDGEITQMVAHADMAQHIGGYNPISFGIEHEGFIYEPGWYTWETYVASAQLTRWLCDHYDISIDREHIVGHVEVPGASHTDPGPYWEWDMYMALVHDVVPQARVEGVVVDRSRACVLTALADTSITTTLETLDLLDADEQCFVPAGTELTYLHASDEMISQYRLTMDGGGPCAGIGTLDTNAYIWAPSFTPLCPAADLAAGEGVTVRLDGVATPVDADGRFTFEGVAAGPHVLDVESDGAWVETSVPIDLDVYPGLRVVIPLDPDGSSDPDGDPNPDPSDSDETGPTPSSDDSGGNGSGSSGQGHAEGTQDDGLPSPPGTDNEDTGAGCGCRGGGRPREGWLLGPTLAVWVRRRVRSRPVSDSRSG